MENKTLTRYAFFLSTVLRHCTVTWTVLLASRCVPSTQRRFRTFHLFAISVYQWCVNSIGSYRRITAVLAGAVQKLVAKCHIKLSQHLCGDPEETRDNLSHGAVSGRNWNMRPPYDDRALTITDVEQQKLRIRKIRGRRRTSGTECKRKECCYVKR